MAHFSSLTMSQIGGLTTLGIGLLIFEQLKRAVIKSYLGKATDIKETFFQKRSVYRLNALCSLLVWGVMALTLLRELALPAESNPVYVYAMVARKVFIIGMLALLLHVLIHETEKQLKDKFADILKLDKNMIQTMLQLLKVSVYLVAVLCILPIFGVPISGVLAFGGMGGLIVGFSAKDIFANLLSGFFLCFDRIFSVGDWIEIADKKLEGAVKKIGFRTTEIVLLSKDVVYVPNSTLSNANIVNKSRKTRREISKKIGIRYDDAEKLTTLKAEIQLLLEQHPGIDTNEPLQVCLSNFEESSLEITLWCYSFETSRVKYNPVVDSILAEILIILKKHDAKLAYPTTTLNINAGASLMTESLD